MRLLHTLQNLAVSFWVGGAALFTFLLTPTLFRSLDRDQAGLIVGLLFPDYFRWGLGCGLVALACLLLTRGRNFRLHTAIVCVMLVINATQALVIEPRAAAIKQQIPSFMTTPPEHPLRQQFKKLHAISALGNLGVIGGGVILIILL